MNKKLRRWKVDNKYFKSEDYKLNNRIASEISEKDYREISYNYTHIEPNYIEEILKISKSIWRVFIGNGIDLGGGVGSVSSVIATSSEVEKIICLEITENCVTKCQPVVISGIARDKKNKVISVIGDFDNLELNEGSLDFAIAWDAIHHSSNVVNTLSEVRRVLKPNSYLVIVDRGHNNLTSNEEIHRMLNVQYSKDFLLKNYLPEDKILTRKDNGEREYRYSEWERFFKIAGFKIEKSLIVREKHEKNLRHTNDANYEEVFVDYEVGGFERQKVIYLLKKP